MTETEDNSKVTICVLGASFDTGNLGVNALAESTIKTLLHRWPQARIVLLGNGYTPEQLHLHMGDREMTVTTLPVRFSRKLSLPYHFFWFAFYGMLAGAVPWPSARRKLLTRNPHCRTIYESALAVDITGGDSFSDIYGMRRFVLGFLRKYVVILFGKRFVMLPQTYGPFKRRIAKALARYIVKHAEVVYSRDKEGMECVRGLLNGCVADKVRFSPDVAFVLDPRRPERLCIEPNDDLRAHGSTVAGFNVSGLLFNGGYTRNNMFGLKADYRELVCKIMDLLLRQPDVVVLLVPHVLPPAGLDVESDPIACAELFEHVRRKYPGRVFLARGRYNHNEIKYVIGQCDFFAGSRMHACIAALSQGIPAVGLAYSKKFLGVFESVGMADWVVDLRTSDEDEVLGAMLRAFETRKAAAESLQQTVPAVQQQILGLFSTTP